MKNLIIFLLFLFPVANAALSSILGRNLVEQTCKQTPYYDICVRALLSNPQSYDADQEGLARIMVYTVEAKSIHAAHRINKLQEHGHLDSREKKALQSCAQRYSTIIKADVPQVIKALKSGNFKFAEEGANDAATEAKSCEKDFTTGKSPLAETNTVVHHTSIVAASIIKLLESA